MAGTLPSKSLAAMKFLVRSKRCDADEFIISEAESDSWDEAPLSQYQQNKQANGIMGMKQNPQPYKISNTSKPSDTEVIASTPFSGKLKAFNFDVSTLPSPISEPTDTDKERGLFSETQNSLHVKRRRSVPRTDRDFDKLLQSRNRKEQLTSCRITLEPMKTAINQAETTRHYAGSILRASSNVLNHCSGWQMGDGAESGWVTTDCITASTAPSNTGRVITSVGDDIFLNKVQGSKVGDGQPLSNKTSVENKRMKLSKRVGSSQNSKEKEVINNDINSWSSIQKCSVDSNIGKKKEAEAKDSSCGKQHGEKSVGKEISKLRSTNISSNGASRVTSNNETHLKSRLLANNLSVCPPLQQNSILESSDSIFEPRSSSAAMSNISSGSDSVFVCRKPVDVQNSYASNTSVSIAADESGCETISLEICSSSDAENALLKEQSKKRKSSLPVPRRSLRSSALHQIMQNSNSHQKEIKEVKSQNTANDPSESRSSVSSLLSHKKRERRRQWEEKRKAFLLSLEISENLPHGRSSYLCGSMGSEACDEQMSSTAGSDENSTEEKRQNMVVDRQIERSRTSQLCKEDSPKLMLSSSSESGDSKTTNQGKNGFFMKSPQVVLTRIDDHLVGNVGNEVDAVDPPITRGKQTTCQSENDAISTDSSSLASTSSGENSTMREKHQVVAAAEDIVFDNEEQALEPHIAAVGSLNRPNENDSSDHEGTNTGKKRACSVSQPVDKFRKSNFVTKLKKNVVKRVERPKNRRKLTSTLRKSFACSTDTESSRLVTDREGSESKGSREDRRRGRDHSPKYLESSSEELKKRRRLNKPSSSPVASSKNPKKKSAFEMLAGSSDETQNEASEAGVCTKRPVRHRIPPTQFWLGQRVEYSLSQKIIKVSDVNPPVTHEQQRLKPKKTTVNCKPLQKKKTKKKLSFRKLSLAETKPELNEEVADSDISVISNSRVLVCQPKDIIMKIKKSGRTVETNGVLEGVGASGFGRRSNLLVFAAGGYVNHTASRNFKMCYVLDGTILYKCHDEENLELPAGAFFIVPDGSSYSIKNLSKSEAKLVVSNIRE